MSHSKLLFEDDFKKIIFEDNTPKVIFKNDFKKLIIDLETISIIENEGIGYWIIEDTFIVQ